MDKTLLVLFVSSIRWPCTILMSYSKFNEDIERAVRGVCAIRPESPQNACYQRILSVAVLAYNLLILRINGLIFQNGRIRKGQFGRKFLLLTFRFRCLSHLTVFYFREN